MAATRSLTLASCALAATFALASQPLAQTAPSSSGQPATGASAAPAPSRVVSETSAGPTQPQPFGPGVRVEFECDKPWVYAFVAKGALDDRPTFPDPFVKVGRLPLAIELPPGTYTVIAEGESVPTASRVFKVESSPVHVKVKAGSQGLRTTGSLLTAIGGIALVAGLVFEVSGAKSDDASKKQAIAVPLLIAGGVGLAGGITMLVVSGTSLEDDGPTSQSGSGRAAESFRGVTLVGSF